MITDCRMLVALLGGMAIGAILWLSILLPALLWLWTGEWYY